MVDSYSRELLYSRFAEISRDKTAIIVTHRLGSVRLADRILVMHGGRLVEMGSHEDLMALGGEYAACIIRRSSGITNTNSHLKSWTAFAAFIEN